MGRRRFVIVAGLTGVASALAVGCEALATSDDEAIGEHPVITLPKVWNSYPSAQVVDDLALHDNCLLLGGEVVFWPHGTGWDSSAQTVTLDGLPLVSVGEVFDGGGGHYGPGVDFDSWLGDETGAAIEDCLRRTNAPGVVYAYASP
jgi:hypothetical protein